jgi:hypothetical protein
LVEFKASQQDAVELVARASSSELAVTRAGVIFWHRMSGSGPPAHANTVSEAGRTRFHTDSRIGSKVLHEAGLLATPRDEPKDIALETIGDWHLAGLAGTPTGGFEDGVRRRTEASTEQGEHDAVDHPVLKRQEPTDQALFIHLEGPYLYVHMDRTARWENAGMSAAPPERTARLAG